MKLKFDSNLEYQLEAIDAVTDLFEGLPPKQSEFEISIAPQITLSGLSELGVGNRLQIDHEQLLRNLHNIQEQNNIPSSHAIIQQDDTYSFPNFSVEMETGTGKTYIYLRTLFELDPIRKVCANRSNRRKTKNISNEIFRSVFP